MKYQCYYGNANLKRSSLKEYEKNECLEKRITHINHPLDKKSNPKEDMSNIWLKTHGLKAFVIECNTKDVLEIIKELNLKE